MSYLAGLVILLVPYWLGPILVWLTQKVRAEAAFEPFAPERHAGFHVVADLFQTGQVKRVSTRAVGLGPQQSASGILPTAAVPHRGAAADRAVEILRELGMAGPDPRPIAQPRARVSIAWVAESRAEGLIAAAQQRFFDKGFYLFRSQQNFGIRGRPDHVALFPRSDPYEILRLMGTNGWNYDIGPDSIVAWLRALERDHPLVLTGIAFDWVEGRFRSAIGDAEVLARRFYALCPDIVDQGTETVEALARELVESRRLYCWWD